MNKMQTISDPKSCLNKAESDEPIFVLRGKDPLAAQTVRNWAEAALALGTHSVGKAQDALEIAQRMDDWRNRQPQRQGDDA